MVKRAVGRDWRCFAVVLNGGELVCYLAYVLLREVGCLGFTSFEAKSALT